MLYPGEENGDPLQYSCLENPMDRSLVCYGSWGRKESDMTWQLNNNDKHGSCSFFFLLLYVLEFSIIETLIEILKKECFNVKTLQVVISLEY